MSSLLSSPVGLAIIGAAVLIAGAALYVLFVRDKQTSDVSFECASQGQLVSEDELHALIYLRRAVANKGHVCPRVDIAHILTPTQASKATSFHETLNDLPKTYLDFVVMDPSGNIEFAIELDTGKQDQFVTELFQQSDIELIKVCLLYTSPSPRDRG